MYLNPDNAVEGTVIEVTEAMLDNVLAHRVWAGPAISPQLTEGEESVIHRAVWYALLPDHKSLRVLRQPSFEEEFPWLVDATEMADAHLLVEATPSVKTPSLAWRVVDYFFGEARLLVNGKEQFVPIRDDAEGAQLLDKYGAMQQGECPLLA